MRAAQPGPAAEMIAHLNIPGARDRVAAVLTLRDPAIRLWARRVLRRLDRMDRRPAPRRQ